MDSSDKPDKRLRKLSKRERDIAERYATGLNYRQIAEALFISDRTVRNHISTIYRKLEIGSKVELIQLFASVAETTEEPTAEPDVASLAIKESPLTGWLESLGMGMYATAFAENAIDWELLPTLTDEDLRGLGVEAIGHRKTLVRAIAALSPAPSGAAEHVVGTAERRQLSVLVCGLLNPAALTRQLDAEQLPHLFREYDLVKHFDTTQLSGFWSIQELLFKRIWTDVIQR